MKLDPISNISIGKICTLTENELFISFLCSYGKYSNHGNFYYDGSKNIVTIYGMEKYRGISDSQLKCSVKILLYKKFNEMKAFN